MSLSENNKPHKSVTPLLIMYVFVTVPGEVFALGGHDQKTKTVTKWPKTGRNDEFSGRNLMLRAD